MTEAELKIQETFYSIIKYDCPNQTFIDQLEKEFACIHKNLIKLFPNSCITSFGSWNRLTATKHSDVDLLLVMSKDVYLSNEEKQLESIDPFIIKKKNVDSKKIIDKIFLTIRKYFPSEFEVSISSPAISLKNPKLNISFEVIPAIPVEPKFGVYPDYLIPNDLKNWERTMLRSSTKFIQGADYESKGMINRITKIHKFWSTCFKISLPYSSFQIETVMTATGCCNNSYLIQRAFYKSVVAFRNMIYDGCSNPYKSYQSIPFLKDRNPSPIEYEMDDGFPMPKKEDMFLLFDLFGIMINKMDRAKKYELENDYQNAFNEWNFVFKNKLINNSIIYNEKEELRRQYELMNIFRKCQNMLT